LHSVEESLRFDYGWEDLGLPAPAAKSSRPTHGNRLMDAVQGARLQSDISLNVASESFVGVKLFLPLGD
jgi:hypothetical protein